MWKVILVEDEIFVRDSIKQLISWSSLGFSLVGEAGDGTEAIELIEGLKPDLVISDIIMPEMDGVTLLKRVREQGLDTRFIMLTCMNDFEYAREALEFGASGYILKLSMNIRTLEDSLVKVKQELEKSTDLQFRENQLMRLSAAFERIWRTMTSVSAKAVRLNLDTVEDGLHKAGIRLSGLFVVLHGTNPLPSAWLDWIEKVGEARIYTELGISTILTWTSHPGDLKLQWNQAFQYRYVYADIHSLEQVPETWALLLARLNDCWYGAQDTEQDKLYIVNQRGEAGGVLWETERRLTDAMEHGLAEETEEMIRKVWNEMKMLRLPLHQVKIMASHVVSQYCRVTNTAFEEAAATNIEASITHEQLRSAVIFAIVEDMKRKGYGTASVTNHPEVKKILLYIHEHYAENEIGLRSMAEYVNMNENYLSSLFRKKTGESLIHYLQHFRVKKSLRYLETTELTINEISALVGFGNDHYLIKVFKKLMDMTPNEYRKSIQGVNHDGFSNI